MRKKSKCQFKPITIGTYTIRELEPEDWKIYRRLYLRALKDAPTIFPDDYSVMKKLSDQEWKDQLADLHDDARSIIVGVFYGNKDLVGLLKVHGETPSTMIHMAEIQGVYMTDEHNEKEVQKQILEEVMKFLKKTDINKLRAAVVTTNRDEIALFNELGFIRYGYDQDHYKIGRKFYDSILIAKVL